MNEVRCQLNTFNKEGLMVLARHVAVIGLVLSAPASAASADSTDHLGADFWQWAFPTPTPHNPLVDPTGADCGVGQNGKTWFLAGGLGGGTFTRSCTVPKKRRIAFPIVNSFGFNSPNICGQGPEDFSVDELREQAAAFINGVSNVSATLDGQPITDIEFLQSRVFSMRVPEDNIVNLLCIPAGLGAVPGGQYKPTVDTGYYVELGILEPGDHTLHFHAENLDAGFLLDVTYNLTIAR